MSNDTCRKILNFLADNDATETEISEKQNIPISTVHYNLQQLIKGGLVVSEEFHYSEKGKEVQHYKLANKYIIIAPKSTWGLKEKLKKILPLGIVTVVVAGLLELSTFMTWGGGMLKAGGNELTRESSAFVAQDMAAAPVAQAATTGAVEAVTTAGPTIWQHAGLWFLIGAAFVFIIYFLINWKNSRK